MSKAGHLACCVCGGDAGKWHQWWNRDTGYGICRRCVEWVVERGETAEQIRDYYGVEGVNYAPKAEAPPARWTPETARQRVGGTFGT